MDTYKELKGALSNRNPFGEVKLTNSQYLLILDAVEKIYGGKCPMCDDCPHGCKLSEVEQMTNNEAIYILKNTAWLGTDKGIEVYPAVKFAVGALEFVNDLIGFIHKNHMDETDAEIMCRKLLKYGLIELDNDGDYLLVYDEVE